MRYIFTKRFQIDQQLSEWKIKKNGTLGERNCQSVRRDEKSKFSHSIETIQQNYFQSLLYMETI